MINPASVRVPSRTLRRVDVTAKMNSEAVNYDWSGFRVAISPARLPGVPVGARPERWELVVRMATLAARRGNRVGGPSVGRALSPQRVLTQDAYRQMAAEFEVRYPRARRCAGDSPGAGASSITFWWRRCTEHSRSP